MMNGRERSDPAIVAVKPTNKAGQPTAEPGEPTVSGSKDCAGGVSVGWLWAGGARWSA
jgi:hypothetical protein